MGPMDDLVIRRAPAADVWAVVAMLADDPLGARRESPGDPAYAAAFAQIDADPRQYLAVAVSGVEVVGTLQLPGLGGGVRTERRRPGRVPRAGGPGGRGHRHVPAEIRPGPAPPRPDRPGMN